MNGSDEFYWGARVALEPGDEVRPADGYVYFSDHLDAAIWAAELADGDAEPRVYRVAPTGTHEDASRSPDFEAPRHPSMTLRSVEPLVVREEVSDWTHYHGTRADLQIGEMIEPGRAANFGPTPRLANFVYFARTLDAAIWGAELAAGGGRERIYTVEPTGAFEDDPNLTDMKFRGNPTKSFRSRAPLRVTGEVEVWTGHPEAVVRAMKAGLEKLDAQGIEPDD